MANYFEKVSKFAAADFNLPIRKTKNSAGYDFEVAEDIVVPSYEQLALDIKLRCFLQAAFSNANQEKTKEELQKIVDEEFESEKTLIEIAKITKTEGFKPTLVSTGVKCHLDPGYYLELSVRSSTPLKYWLILANGIGIIDADYWNNESNEGEIFFQLINLSPWPIQLKRGDVVGQGVIKKYEITDDDIAEGERTGGFGSTTKEVMFK